MKKTIKITSLCLIGCLYITAVSADEKKAIWGTDGQAITKKPTPVQQTLKPKTEAQINPKRVETVSGMSGKKPQINPKPQTVENVKPVPKIREKTPAATPINLPKPTPTE